MKKITGRFYFFLGVMTTIFIISACNTGSIYNQSVSFDSSWNRYDTAKFNVNIQDTTQLYNFYVNLRNNNAYRYSNLYVFLHSKFPNGNITHDTLEFMLANRSGEWLGKGIGEIKENNILIRKNMQFPLTGEYTFKLEQGMRTHKLQGIEDIGISIEKAD